MENQVYSHEILVAGADFSTCEAKVRRFFSRTELVRYDGVRIAAPEALRGDAPGFWPRLEQGVAANRRVVGELLEELDREGIESLADIREMDQGSGSKVFHTIAHLLDGFFGIDSAFYNLEDDSHWVSPLLRERIKTEPASFRLLPVEGFIQIGGADPPGQLRPFERTDD